MLTSDDELMIERWVEEFGLLGPLVLVLCMVIQMFMFVVPNIFLMIVAIISYGPLWGAVISFIGVFASSTTGYILGRWLGPVTAQKLMSAKTQREITAFIQRYGVLAIGITRISSLSNDSLSIVAGVLKMRYKHYILATLLGITPLIVLLAVYGNNGKILKALVWIAAISLVMLIIYIRLDKKNPNRRT